MMQIKFDSKRIHMYPYLSRLSRDTNFKFNKFCISLIVLISKAEKMEIPEYDDPDIGREDYEFPDIGREETNSNNDISEDEPEVEGMVQDQFGAQVNEQNGTSSQCSSYVDLLNFKSNQFPLPTAFTLLERPLNGGGVQLNSGNQTQQQLQNRSFLELSRDGLQVVYVGAGQTDNEAASIRSNYSISPQVGIYYYEVAILDRGREGFIAVGLCARTVNLGRLTGTQSLMTFIGHHKHHNRLGTLLDRLSW